MRLLVLTAAVAFSGCAAAFYSDNAVTRFIERADMCAHWSGEEPYDAGRRAEIDSALREMQCATLLRDGEALKISLKDRPEVVGRTNEALAAF